MTNAQYTAIVERIAASREEERLAFIRTGQRTEVDDEGLLVVLDDLDTPLDYGATRAWLVRVVIQQVHGGINVCQRMVWADTAQEAQDRVLADVPSALVATCDEPEDLGPVEPDSIAQRAVQTLDYLSAMLAAS